MFTDTKMFWNSWKFYCQYISLTCLSVHNTELSFHIVYNCQTSQSVSLVVWNFTGETNVKYWFIFYKTFFCSIFISNIWKALRLPSDRIRTGSDLRYWLWKFWLCNFCFGFSCQTSRQLGNIFTAICLCLLYAGSTPQRPSVIVRTAARKAEQCRAMRAAPGRVAGWGWLLGRWVGQSAAARWRGGLVDSFTSIIDQTSLRFGRHHFISLHCQK